MHELSPTVFVETEYPGSNVSAIETQDGMVLVDAPMYPSHALAWRERVRRRGPVRYLLHTEYHPDHVRGDRFLEPPSIVAHEIVWQRTALSADEDARYRQVVERADPEGAAHLEGWAQARPQVTFSERLGLHLGDTAIELVHLPGHCPAQTAVWLPEARIVFTGDNVVYRVHPFLGDAVPRAWLQSLERLAGLEPAVVVPGHGEVCGPEGIAEMAAYLGEAIGRVEDAIRAGWSRDETVARVSLLSLRPVPEGEREMRAQGEQRGIAHLYDALSEGA